MVIKALNFIVGTRTNAILAVVMGSMIAGFNWLAVSIISLVTLQKGEAEGGNLLGCMLLLGLFYYLSGSNYFIWNSIIFTALPVWVLSIVLRRTASWSIVMEALVLAGIVGIIILYSFFPDWVYASINSLLANFFDVVKQFGISNPDMFIVEMSFIISSFAIGGFVFFILLHVLLMIMLGRIFQAKLYNQDGFKVEFTGITVGWMSNALLALASVGTLANLTLAKAFLPIVFLPFIIVGISVIHCLANQRKYGKMILMFFYIALILYSPAIILFLVVIAILEKHFNFRVVRT